MANMLAKLILTSVRRLIPNLRRRQTRMSRLQRTDCAVQRSERCLLVLLLLLLLDDMPLNRPTAPLVELRPLLFEPPPAESNDDILNLSLKLADDELVPVTAAVVEREPNRREVSTPEKHDRGLV